VGIYIVQYYEHGVLYCYSVPQTCVSCSGAINYN